MYDNLRWYTRKITEKRRWMVRVRYPLWSNQMWVIRIINFLHNYRFSPQLVILELKVSNSSTTLESRHHIWVPRMIVWDHWRWRSKYISKIKSQPINVKIRRNNWTPSTTTRRRMNVNSNQEVGVRTSPCRLLVRGEMNWWININSRYRVRCYKYTIQVA